MKKYAIVYGFVNEAKIHNEKQLILCKSIKSGLPIYAFSEIIEETEIFIVVEKIKEMEKLYKRELTEIDTKAKQRWSSASWRVVLFGHDLKFDVGYENGIFL